VLRFEAGGSSFLRWHSKKKQRLVVLIDGEVLAAPETREEIRDGQLSVSLWAGADRKAFAAKVKTLSAGALSHRVVIRDDKAP
jgi:hypothetical protein